MRLLPSAFPIPSQKCIFADPPFKGLRMETKQALKAFGIPVSELPVTSNGVIKTGRHLQWIKSREVIDSERKNELSRKRKAASPTGDFK